MGTSSTLGEVPFSFVRIGGKGNVEPIKRAHSPLLNFDERSRVAAGLASVYKDSIVPYGRRFPADCSRVFNQDLTLSNLRYIKVRLPHKEEKGTILAEPFFETPSWQQANELGGITFCLCLGEGKTVSRPFWQTTTVRQGH